MKILVAPLNWGLGHASRCVPIVQRFLDDGHEVILGGDGESLTLLRRHFPGLRYVYLAPLHLRYSSGKRQVWAMLCALPRLLLWAYKDHVMLRAVLREEKMDMVVSDNRFGLYIPHHGENEGDSPVTIYITHQLHIMLPRGWRWLETFASRLHARVYTRFNKVWVPDYAEKEKSLAGELSHPGDLRLDYSGFTIQYIGPQSRLQSAKDVRNANEMRTVYDAVAVLSGLEPQRTILERELIERYKDTEENVLIVQGLLHRPNTRIRRGKITIVPHLKDDELVQVLTNARHIIARSGYSTIMDLAALSLLAPSTGKQGGVTIEFIPTPGQPEQEYLAFWAKKCMFK